MDTSYFQSRQVCFLLVLQSRQKQSFHKCYGIKQHKSRCDIRYARVVFRHGESKSYLQQFVSLLTRLINNEGRFPRKQGLPTLTANPSNDIHEGRRTFTQEGLSRRWNANIRGDENYVIQFIEHFGHYSRKIVCDPCKSQLSSVCRQRNLKEPEGQTRERHSQKYDVQEIRKSVPGYAVP